MKRFIPILVACSMGTFLHGCNAGDGTGLNDDGQPVDLSLPDPPSQPEPPDEDSLQANLASIQEKVLVPRCTQCHAGGNAPLGLAMDDLATSQSNLINVDSATNSSFKRVLPGDAENSFLYLKISGAPIAGNQMPLGEAPLDQETQNTIKDWINNGAPIDSSQVTVVANTMSVTADTVSVALAFSNEMSSDTLSANDVQVFSTTNNELISATTNIQWSDEKTLNINISGLDPALTGIALVLNEPLTSTIIDKHGFVLDGDMDGNEGGVFTYEILK